MKLSLSQYVFDVENASAKEIFSFLLEMWRSSIMEANEFGKNERVSENLTFLLNGHVVYVFPSFSHCFRSLSVKLHSQTSRGHENCIVMAKGQFSVLNRTLGSPRRSGRLYRVPFWRVYESVC